MSRRVAAGVGIAALVIGAGWLLFVGLPQRYGSQPRAESPATSNPPAAERKITATLYYISEDGLALVGVQREVAFGEPIGQQAQRILEAQLARPPEPLSSAIPEATTLKSFFLDDRGHAFVDLSADARLRHTGGALDELFTIYTIVNALTVNLPAITRVQILVDGKEVDTLAGHVDLRHPLQKNLKWVRAEEKDGS
jgi:hypothetical protein